MQVVCFPNLYYATNTIGYLARGKEETFCHDHFQHMKETQYSKRGRQKRPRFKGNDVWYAME
jgi:hypothetical protein